MAWDSGEQHAMENGGHCSPREPRPGVGQLVHSPAPSKRDRQSVMTHFPFHSKGSPDG